MDDLPVWGFGGPPPEETKDEEHIYIYTHKSFDINYNDNRVCTFAMLSVMVASSFVRQSISALRVLSC